FGTLKNCIIFEISKTGVNGAGVRAFLVLFL
ncbi:MAG: hypothetical protein AVDCRST_MAG74-2504, partial [uncultured Pyrinomonadaceae bacterium]